MKPKDTHALHLWLRAETKTNESRSPITPQTARVLLNQGLKVTVERSPSRIFDDTDFQREGCTLAPPASWPDAPPEAFILGLKEVPQSTAPLRHRHIYFAHAFKGQSGSNALLGRFKEGGGTLLDLEALTHTGGRRVAAFGYWAGYVGAALALASWFLQREGATLADLKAFHSQDQLDQFVQQQQARHSENQQLAPQCLIIGAKGRSGQGAIRCIEKHAGPATLWDLEETAGGGPFTEINGHDILINCVLLSEPTPPFVTPESLETNERLRTIIDVSCDPYHPYNPIPIYREHTSFACPSRSIEQSSIQLISIDNLPSLLPRESSEDFASQLLPHLIELGAWSLPWINAQTAFEDACRDCHDA